MKAHGFTLCCCFCYFASACVLKLISFWPTRRLAVMSRACQLISHLQLFIREDTVTREMWVINEPAHIAVGCNYLK